MGLKWTLLLVVGVLLSCGSSLDWMGGGNFTQDNLTVIRAKINAFDLTSPTTAYAASASTLSTELNTLWAPAWNVVIVYNADGKNYDAVLYGYGFNGHWFWFNGMKTSTNKYISFIIWKDFNCVTWYSINSAILGFVTSTYGKTDGAAIYNALLAGYAGRNIADIWRVAQTLQAAVAVSGGTVFNDKLAYSVIASPYFSPYLFAKICVKHYYIINSMGTASGTPQGAALIMQMR